MFKHRPKPEVPKQVVQPADPVAALRSIISEQVEPSQWILGAVLRTIDELNEAGSPDLEFYAGDMTDRQLNGVRGRDDLGKTIPVNGRLYGTGDDPDPLYFTVAHVHVCSGVAKVEADPYGAKISTECTSPNDLRMAIGSGVAVSKWIARFINISRFKGLRESWPSEAGRTDVPDFEEPKRPTEFQWGR